MNGGVKVRMIGENIRKLISRGRLLVTTFKASKKIWVLDKGAQIVGALGATRLFPQVSFLLFSKMQQKPPNATKAPYAQSLILEGEYNFLVNFKIRNNFFFQIWLKYCIFKNNHQIFKSAPTDMIMK